MASKHINPTTFEIGNCQAKSSDACPLMKDHGIIGSDTEIFHIASGENVVDKLESARVRMNLETVPTASKRASSTQEDEIDSETFGSWVYGARRDDKVTADQWVKVIGPMNFAALGASKLSAIPGKYKMGGLGFQAKILPLRNGKRSTQPRKMQVILSLTPGDGIEMDIYYPKRKAKGADEFDPISYTKHASTKEFYVSELQRVLISVDYDGDEAFNSRYWTES